MGYWDHREILLHEVQLGNNFYIHTVRTVIVTGLHISGKVQVADFFSGEIINQDITFKNLIPIDLPKGANISLLEGDLKSTVFKKVGLAKFIAKFDDLKVIIERDFSVYPKWRMTLVDDEGVIDEDVVEFYHELQNTYTRFTKKRLVISRVSNNGNIINE
ncbi:MAG TPA: hypothetical protein PLU07_10030 [Ferruginibacter sp.]|nr:hypothetical protein [Ferruginibacter sp.]